MKQEMIVSVCVVAYNEEDYLPGLLECILEQDYDHKKIEVVLVDSMSTDTTKQKMQEFMKLYKDSFWDIQVADNIKKIQSSGWNKAISISKGDIIIKNCIIVIMINLFNVLLYTYNPLPILLFIKIMRIYNRSS